MSLNIHNVVLEAGRKELGVLSLVWFSGRGIAFSDRPLTGNDFAVVIG